MGWPFAIVLLMLMLVAFDRRGRTGAFLEALTGFVDRLRRVVIGGTEITTDMEEALQRNPAVGVDPLGKPGKQGKSSDDDLVRKLIAKDFSNVILGDYPYLMHEGKKTPKGRFPFAARVYLEFWTSNEQRFQKEDVEKVFYRVDDTFPEGWWVMSSMEAKTDFQLVVRIIGEFTIVAVVKLKSGDYIWLTRYLDLPGRPVD